MSIDQERLRLDLRDILSEAAEALLDYRLASMEQEISEGWAYFHAREIWFKENIPPPLINELGRHYMCEQLRSELYQRRAEIGTDYKGCFLRDFFHKPPTSGLDIETFSMPAVKISANQVLAQPPLMLSSMLP